MAYCKSCGAYIPDGQNVCLACGYDENAEKEKSTASTASTGAASASASAASAGAAAAAAQEPEKQRSQYKYRQFDSETLRKQLDEQRKRQQDNSRKWAETEYAQRQKVKEEQARNFTNTARKSRAKPYTDTVRNTVQNADASKVMAGMSYISALFLVPMFLSKNNRFVDFHAKQGMKLFLAGLVGRLIGSIIGLGWLVTAAQVYLAYIGIRNVMEGKCTPLPYVGQMFK